MHGFLSDESKRKALGMCSERFCGTTYYSDIYYEIVDNSFLVKVLKTVLEILTTLDDALCEQRNE